MTEYRVIGIDPALTATGLCVLESKGPKHFEVVDSLTVRTHTKQPMLARLSHLLIGSRQFLDQSVDAIVVEDPTRQVAINRAVRPGTIAVMGVAVGVVLSAVLDCPASKPIAFIGTEEWMPKLQNRKGGWYIMPHADMTRHLMGRIKFPPGVSEHVVMAAGVARHWINQQRLAERRIPA